MARGSARARRIRPFLGAAATAVLALAVTTAPGPERAAATTPSHVPAYPSHVDPTPGAVSVLDPAFGLTGDANVDPDDTAAFSAAIAVALAAPLRFGAGPTGEPQAVVYVPPGSYRLNGLVLPSDVRLEIDAGAVLEPIQAPTDRTLTAQDPIQLIQLGSHDTTPVTNVSIVGVGTGAVDSPLKQRAAPTYDDWDIGGYFTVDLDAADTGAPNDFGFAGLINVVGFEISNVYIVQNDTLPTCSRTSSSTCPVGRGFYPSPTTGRAAIVFKPGHQSGTTTDGPFYDPTQGSLTDVYSVGAPYGFGPTQVASGHDLTFADLYSEGGTTLRLETDDAATKRYLGELADVTADHVVGTDSNRAVSFSAHQQVNHDVAVSDVTAVGCQDGAVQAAVGRTGTFAATTLTDLQVDGGTHAQVPLGGKGLWRAGTSLEPVENKVPKRAWSVVFGDLTCTGPFSRRTFDPVLLDGLMQAPACG